MTMITRFVKILVGVGVALIVAHSVLDVLALDMILPAAIALSFIIFIGSVLWKKGVLPNSSRSYSRGITRYETKEYTSSSASAPRAKTTRAKKTTKAAKPKMPKPNCKYAKLMTDPEQGKMFCYCESSKAPSFSRYAGVSRRNGVNVSGSSTDIGSGDNLWNLCVKGKRGGRTDSQCPYYAKR